MLDISNKLRNIMEENESSTPFEAFNNAYNKSNDKEEMQKIVDEVKRYNIYDFLAKLSALNLISENQNKSVLFDALVASILSLNRVDYTSKNIMSSSKFRKVINRIENLDLKRAIDPTENIFVDNIMFYENYYIFNGINYIPGYCLQIMIKTLILHSENYNPVFLKSASNLIRFILMISTYAASDLGYCIDNLDNIETKNIIIPGGGKLDQIAAHLVVDNDYIRTMLQDEVLIDELYSDFGKGDIEKALIAEQQKFYSKPFLRADNNTSIVLNISSLASFALHRIICLAEKYNQQTELISMYNISAWKDCRRSLSNLGHAKIKEEHWGIELLERNNYKEVLLNVFNNQIMIVSYISDEGIGYSDDTMSGNCPYDKFSELIERRGNYLFEKLHLQNLKDEDIFHVIIVNSFGRIIRAGIKEDYFYKPLVLNPFELSCIAINEKSNTAFIPRYIRAKSKLLDTRYIFSELNNIEIYTNNDYSFYINDDFNPRKNSLYIDPGDSIDYIIRAKNKEKRHLIESYNESYFTEVVLNDEARDIFVDPNSHELILSLLVKFKSVGIWLFSKQASTIEELNLYYSIIDTLSYWLAECKEIIEIYNFVFEIIKIEISLDGDPHEYYYESPSSCNLKENVSFEINNNIIKLVWTPEAFRLFSCEDNRIEKQMSELIIEQLGYFTLEGEIKADRLDLVFANPLKKKMFHLDYINYPYLKPLHDREFHIIKAEDENELLDIIGNAVLASGKWSYGVVKDEDRTTIANFVVSYLYEMLQKQIKELRSDYFVELVCLDLEKVMYNLMLAQARYAYDIACYPEKQNKILNDFNELNKASRAMKFLAEYIAACPPNGSKILGEWQYEKLLAICSLIIDWAYKNDLFYYKIFTTPIEILKSDRIGMKQDEFNKLQIINLYAREEQLNSTSTPKLREKLPQDEFPDIKQQLNDAFMDEYAFSFDDFYNFIFQMISFGDQINTDVKKANRDELITSILNGVEHLTKEKAEKIIQYISLSRRDDYLKPKQPYRKEEVYPWRFNRELSFTRRPVIIRNSEVIWGNRQLFHMLLFTIDLIYEGKLKTREKKLSKLIGKINDKRGKDFNNKVYNKIVELNEFIADKNLKKVNHINIANESGETLGDIDILYIIPDKKKIVVAEVKDFSFSKSPYEMDCEYKSMFVDTGDKKCFATKHQRRSVWIKDHIEDVKIQYDLTGDGWTIRDIFIVNKRIISNAFYDAGLTIITYDSISAATLRRI